MARLIVAGMSSGVGKTTITVGLIAALRRRGLRSSRSRSVPTTSTRPTTHWPPAVRAETSTPGWSRPTGCWPRLLARRMMSMSPS